ncbi:MAG: hypothetical protein ACI3VJ_00380, partial [Hominicoprocola sp.]
YKVHAPDSGRLRSNRGTFANILPFFPFVNTFFLFFDFFPFTKIRPGHGKHYFSAQKQSLQMQSLAFLLVFSHARWYTILL